MQETLLSVEPVMPSLSALLVVGPRSLPKLATLLKQAESHSRVYVQVNPALPLAENVERIYAVATECTPSLDVRVLLGKKPPPDAQHIGDEPATELATPPSAPFTRVCLGGTFDRLHNGHKSLLSHAVLMAREHIICGVLDGPMIHKKKLWELIEPVHKRQQAVREFISSVSSIECSTEPIEDPYGPAIVDETLQAIVVSEETLKGGEAVNVKRKERGMPELKLDRIPMIGGEDALLGETKLSSSSRRRQLLGTLLRPPNKNPNHFPVYTIGLTGGIASGKSHISKDLQEAGYKVIDCDELVNTIYKTDDALVSRLGDTFPGTVTDGVLDRKLLGEMVFKHPDKLHLLDIIVWPAILAKVDEAFAAAEPGSVVFVDAAALVEAGWHTHLHELWTVFCERDEGIRRVQQRDGLNRAQAEARVSSQVSTTRRLSVSHVVLCSEWERAVTREQVRTACRLMEERRKNTSAV